jgi:hypothetical protein
MTDLELMAEVVTWHTFRVRGSPTQLDRLVAEIDLALPAGWSHEPNKEGELRSKFGSTGYCYRYTSPDNCWGVSLWLSRPKPDQIRGGQFVPLGSPPDPWNSTTSRAIDFYRSAILPAAGRAGLSVGRVHPVEEMLDSATLRKLNEFCDQALQHPDRLTEEDSRRWNEFLSAAYRSRHVADIAALTDWFIARGLPAGRARELAADYDRGISLLESYDPEPSIACR